VLNRNFLSFAKHNQGDDNAASKGVEATTTRIANGKGGKATMQARLCMMF